MRLSRLMLNYGIDDLRQNGVTNFLSWYPYLYSVKKIESHVVRFNSLEEFVLPEQNFWRESAIYLIIRLFPNATYNEYLYFKFLTLCN